MIGETISRYRIIDSLGEGGMGIVYLAEDINLGRHVAIKFLTSTTPEYRARFLREARAVSNLVHPNIATVFDYGETAVGKPFIVMELVKGQALNEKLHEGSLPLPDAVRFIAAIASALSEAHHQGVVHRDVKPSNVIITDRKQVKVLDFGLVKQIYGDQVTDTDTSRMTLPGTRTRSDVIVGTPLYLSPEQATGKQVDGRSDLFALGAVMYECITGHSAFGGASVIEIGAQVIHVTPPAPSKLNPAIPPELDRITMKALEKKVEARYQSADELIADLQAVLPTLQADGSRTLPRGTKKLIAPSTHSVSALQTMTDLVVRPRLSIVTLVGVILGLALLTWAVVQWRRPAPYKPNSLAQDWYNKGSEALRNGAFLQASKAFEQAVAADNNFPLGHARLAEAWFELDYADRAKDEMLKVQSLAQRSPLAKTDALYLDAIYGIVSKDFPAAVNAYKELAKISPNDSQVYVDLGRAYEKNDDIKLAIDSFVEATNRAPQDGTAFLRIGILYGRQGDQPAAIAAFDKADTLYQAVGNFEGQAEVAYQRGYLFNQLGKPQEAHEPLKRALEIARTTANEYQQVKTLLKLGDVTVDLGKVEEGRQLMHEALALAEAKGIDNYIKRGLVDIGNTYVASGQYDEAEKYYKRSFALSQTQKDPRNSARALLVLASLAERRGNTDEQLRYVDQALPFYELGGYRKEQMQVKHLLARAKVAKGDYEPALQTLNEALQLAQRIGDLGTMILAKEDIGLIYIRQGKYPTALAPLQESYDIAKSLRSAKNAALLLIDRSNALWRLGRYEEARLALNETAGYAEKPDTSRNVSASYNLALARIALSERRFADAQAKARVAIQLASEAVTSSATGGRSALGMAMSESGASNTAKQTCEEAVELARQSADPYLLSEALLALAHVLNRTGDNSGALQAAMESQQLFARSSKQDSEWMAWLIAASATAKTGDMSKAHEYATRAESLLSSLEQQWGSDNYRSYLTRPDIQFSRKQLSDLIAGKP
jgi:eukaryotic-like serine/threonine-protein kinase